VCVAFALATLLPAARAVAAPLEPVALPAVPGSEVEPNDGLATATPIASGERIRANLPASDVDYYSFTAVAGERVFANTVTAGSTGGSSDTVLTLLDSQEMEIEQDDNDGSQLGKASSLAGTPITADGTYFLKVSNGGGGAIAPYDLYFQQRSGIALAETDLTNGTPSGADPLGNGEVTGEHASAGDQDWYSMQLQAGDTVFLSLDLSPEVSKVQLGFGLAGDAGKQVLAVPASGEPPDPSAPSEALTMTVSTSGTYYASVASTDKLAAENWTYDLSATVIPAMQPSCRTYTSAGGPIPDGGSASFPIAVEDSVQIVRAAVGLNIKDSVMHDLTVSLRNPAMVELPLFTSIGATTPEEQTEMEAVFDDFAAVPSMYKALRPLDLQPGGNGRLALLNGQLTRGTWNVVVKDDQLNSSTGTVRGVKLIFCGPESLAAGASNIKAPQQTKPNPPVLSGFAISPGRFRAAKQGPTVLAKRPKVGGTLVNYKDSQAAQTNVVLFEVEPGRKVGGKCVPETKANAAKKPCSRYVKVISFVRHDVPGRNRFGFTGRVGARKLPVGEYQLQAKAYAPTGLTSAPVTATFTILPQAPSK
jgi:subtilisin-like proprotein convertase family protein